MTWNGALVFDRNSALTEIRQITAEKRGLVRRRLLPWETSNQGTSHLNKRSSHVAAAGAR